MSRDDPVRRIGPFHFWFYRMGYYLVGGKSWRVIRFAWWWGQRHVQSRQVWPPRWLTERARRKAHQRGSANG